MTPRDYLHSLEVHGIKLGLDNITRLLQAADNPHQRYPTVHVAGTNGKGSVVAFLDAMLQAAGYKTGRFTSPHLIDLNERFLTGPHPIPDEALDENITFFRATAERMAAPPTFFELVAAVAFRRFHQQRVDLALIEVGMGGRFDATNVATPEVCAITTIDFEHTRYLGDTLEEIAFEKAGIIKPGTPVVVAETEPAPTQVILSRAKELSSPVSLLGREFHYETSGHSLKQQFAYKSASLSLGPIPPGLAGNYQGLNAATAVALAERLRQRFPKLDPKAIAGGLRTARWPCRLEKVLEAPPVIIDVAHNVAGARTLAAELPPCVLVLAVAADKDAARIVEALAPASRALILTRFTGSRGLPVDQLCAAAAAHPHHRTDTLADAIDLGLDLASEALPLVITGSIFTAGEARKILIDRYDAPPLLS